MIANNGDGYDHYCSKNERHALWHPNESRAGKPCPLRVDGHPCGGRLIACGTGSRKANQMAGIK